MTPAELTALERALGTLDEQTPESGADAPPAAEQSAVEAALAVLAAAEAPRRPRSTLRETILKASQAAHHFDGFVERLCPLFDLGPSRMRALLQEIASAPGESWEQSPFAGVQLLHFDGGPHVAGADCGLVRVEAGAPMPSHRHLGDEWMFMLQGRMRDDHGAVSAPGDLIHSAPGTVHDYTVVGVETVVFAVVLREGIEWLIDGNVPADKS